MRDVPDRRSRSTESDGQSIPREKIVQKQVVRRRHRDVLDLICGQLDSKYRHGFPGDACEYL